MTDSSESQRNRRLLRDTSVMEALREQAASIATEFDGDERERLLALVDETIARHQALADVREISIERAEQLDAAWESLHHELQSLLELVRSARARVSAPSWMRQYVGKPAQC